VWDQSGENVPDLRGIDFSSKYDIGYPLVIYGLYCIEVLSSMPSLLRVFIMKR
jgi:hypothetical protein